MLDQDHLTVADLEAFVDSGKKVVISKDVKQRVVACREFLDKKLEKEDKSFYGINTGFGALHNTKISNDELSKLQENLVISHACGIGDEIDQELVRLMLLLKIKGLSLGHSGVQLSTLERLVEFYNEGISPVIYEMGSLGASGDLAPLAHLSLPLIGRGEVICKGVKVKGAEFGQIFGWQPITLKSKEGLALLNGTQFMSAHAVWGLIRSQRIVEKANLIASVSIDAYDAKLEPFDPKLHNIRSHPGQIAAAKAIRDNLKGSKIIVQEKAHVQDPYSFRCIPQVHGASMEAIDRAGLVFEREINAVTDNPTIFPKEDEILSGGNFHGQPLALQLDFLSIALAELGSISERRIYKMVGGERELPAFLVANPGLNSGFMIPQYTAASMVSQNKTLCTPSSVDTIDSSNGQEDHVSMGANAATKFKRVVQNVERILAIEMLVAAQALEFRRPVKSSKIVEDAVNSFRKAVPFVEDDTEMAPLMNTAHSHLFA